MNLVLPSTIIVRLTLGRTDLQLTHDYRLLVIMMGMDGADFGHSIILLRRFYFMRTIPELVSPMGCTPAPSEETQWQVSEVLSLCGYTQFQQLYNMHADLGGSRGRENF